MFPLETLLGSVKEIMDTVKNFFGIGQPKTSEVAAYKSDVGAPTPKNVLALSLLSILVGIVLCFMGWWIIIGIPLMILGLRTNVTTKGCWEAKCPYCGNEVHLPYKRDEKGPVGSDCGICRNRIIFKDGVVLTIADSAANGHKTENAPQKTTQSKPAQPSQNFSIEEQGFDFHDYATYSAWCVQNEHEPMSPAQFEQTFGRKA